MGSERIQQAFGRLEAAIARLEGLAVAPPADAGLAALEERHRKLRDGASDALARLDRLIGASPIPGGEG